MLNLAPTLNLSRKGYMGIQSDPIGPLIRGSIWGQGSNFEVGLWSRWVAIPGFTLGEKSIGDGLRSPKCLLGQIRDQ